MTCLICNNDKSHAYTVVRDKKICAECFRSTHFYTEKERIIEIQNTEIQGLRNQLAVWNQIVDKFIDKRQEHQCC